jgi:hypothetical protein
MKTYLLFLKKPNSHTSLKLILISFTFIILIYSCKKYNSDYTNSLDRKREIQKISDENFINWIKDNPAAKYITPDWSKAKQTIIKGKQLVKVPLLNINKSPNLQVKKTVHYYDSHPPQIYFIADRKEKNGFKSFMLNFVPENKNKEFGQNGIWTGKLYEWDMIRDTVFVQDIKKNRIVKKYYEFPSINSSNPENFSNKKNSKNFTTSNFWDWLGDIFEGIADAVWSAINFIGYHLGVPGSTAWHDGLYRIRLDTAEYIPGSYGGSENGGDYGFDLIYLDYLNANSNNTFYDNSVGTVTVNDYTWDPVYYAGVGSYLSPANVLNAQLDNAIHWGDVNWLDNNFAVRDALDYYLFTLNSNMPQVDKIAFARFTIDFMQDNTNVSIEEFENWFMGISEGKDGDFDSSFWNDPSLTFQLQQLPSKDLFFEAFPKIIQNDVIKPMSSSLVYQMVGGSIYSNHLSGNTNYQNACALRGSRGLLYSGINIPVIFDNNGQQKTEKGGDNKNYILSAQAFNIWMNKTFGTPTHILNEQQALDKNNLDQFLQNKTGIYTIINKDGSVATGAGYSGHVDMIINGKCINGAYLTPKGGIKKIEIWVLE